MAINAPRMGSGRDQRPELRHHVGPRGEAAGDPVAVMPRLPDVAAGPLARIGHVRIVGRAGWTGVTLRLRKAEGAVDLFEIVLSAGGPRQIVMAVVEEDEAVAAWRGVGRATNLPLLLETAAGEVIHPYPQLGAVALGRSRLRRKHSFLKRRPRFLCRRKVGGPMLEDVMIRGVALSSRGER